MTVVVGYVQNDVGAAALAAAIEQLHAGEKLVVVNKAEEVEFSAEQDADALHASLAEQGVDADIVTLFDDDDPAELIVAQAETNAARLVVIGLRRRSPMGKILLGSTAQSVLFNSPCPVLSVRSDD